MKGQFTIKYLNLREVWEIPCVVKIFPVLHLDSLCFPCLERLITEFPVLPVPWPPCWHKYRILIPIIALTKRFKIHVTMLTWNDRLNETVSQYRYPEMIWMKSLLQHWNILTTKTINTLILLRYILKNPLQPEFLACCYLMDPFDVSQHASRAWSSKARR